MRRILALLLIDILVFILLFLPSVRKYKKIVLGRETLMQKKVDLEREYNSLRRKYSIMKREAKDLEELNRTSIFQGEAEMVVLREIIRKAFSRSGVGFKGITFSPPSDSVEGYYKIGIGLPPVETSYRNLRRLIYHLENSPRMIIIKSINIKRIGGGKVSATINLEAYFHET